MPKVLKAKGKIEKEFIYIQRRLPFLCEKYNVVKIPKIEKILDELIFFYNEKHVHEETKQIPNEHWRKGIKERVN